MSEVKIRPLSDKLLIKIIDDTQQTQGGIFIPDSAKEKPQKGEVIAVGNGKSNEKGEKTPLEVKVGEIVLYEKYAGSEMKIDGQVVKILNEKDILGVIE